MNFSFVNKSCINFILAFKITKRPQEIFTLSTNIQRSLMSRVRWCGVMTWRCLSDDMKCFYIQAIQWLYKIVLMIPSNDRNKIFFFFEHFIWYLLLTKIELKLNELKIYTVNQFKHNCNTTRKPEEYLTFKKYTSFYLWNSIVSNWIMFVICENKFWVQLKMIWQNMSIRWVCLQNDI